MRSGLFKSITFTTRTVVTESIIRVTSNATNRVENATFALGYVVGYDFRFSAETSAKHFGMSVGPGLSLSDFRFVACLSYREPSVYSGMFQEGGLFSYGNSSVTTGPALRVSFSRSLFHVQGGCLDWTMFPKQTGDGRPRVSDAEITPGWYTNETAPHPSLIGLPVGLQSAVWVTDLYYVHLCLMSSQLSIQF